MTSDYLLKSKPRIDYSIFQRILRSAGSPALAESKEIWYALLDHGIDPALALAQFAKESSYGLYGYAHVNKSWGNLREYPSGHFKTYPTWTDGANDYARLLASNLYAGSDHYKTAKTMPYRYAPSADHNAPAAYGLFLVAHINHYMSLMPTHIAKYYIVKAGDAFADIAKKYRTTVAVLLHLNPHLNTTPFHLRPGDKVRVS